MGLRFSPKRQPKSSLASVLKPELQCREWRGSRSSVDLKVGLSEQGAVPARFVYVVTWCPYTELKQLGFIKARIGLAYRFGVLPHITLLTW